MPLCVATVCFKYHVVKNSCCMQGYFRPSTLVLQTVSPLLEFATCSCVLREII